MLPTPSSSTSTALLGSSNISLASHTQGESIEPPPPYVPLPPEWPNDRFHEDDDQTVVLGMPFEEPVNPGNLRTEATLGEAFFAHALTATKS